MEPSAQLGLLGTAAAARWGIPAQFALTIPAQHPVSLYWAVLALLVSLLAAAGALYFYRRAKAIDPKERGASKARELEMLRAVIASLPDLIYVKDSESRFLLANQGLVEVMGVATDADLLGKTDFDFYPKEAATAFYEDEQQILRSGQRLVSQEEHILDPDGQPRCLLTTKVPLLNAAGQRIGIIGIGRNITALKEVEAELRETREELKFKAAHDSLTSLFNREAIPDMLIRELARNAREHTSTTVLLGDLDHFKEINDIHGHPVGDEVLQEVARRLVATVRPYDLVGRYGGEEFLLVLTGCAASDALEQADRLRQAVSASPIQTAHGPVPMTISIGVLITQEWGQPTSTEVLREVDIALYAAKAAGRNCCVCATPPVAVAAIDAQRELVTQASSPSRQQQHHSK
jgi:diguanylate cyclase (GGDEF)-like protein/PAS domain S-box-containing protein